MIKMGYIFSQALKSISRRPLSCTICMLLLSLGIFLPIAAYSVVIPAIATNGGMAFISIERIAVTYLDDDLTLDNEIIQAIPVKFNQVTGMAIIGNAGFSVKIGNETNDTWCYVVEGDYGSFMDFKLLRHIEPQEAQEHLPRYFIDKAASRRLPADTVGSVIEIDGVEVYVEGVVDVKFSPGIGILIYNGNSRFFDKNPRHSLFILFDSRQSMKDSISELSTHILPLRKSIGVQMKFESLHDRATVQTPQAMLTMAVIIAPGILILLFSAMNSISILRFTADEKRKETMVLTAMGATSRLIGFQRLMELCILTLASSVAAIAMLLIIRQIVEHYVVKFGIPLAFDMSVIIFTLSLSFLTSVIIQIVLSRDSAKKPINIVWR